MLAQDTVWCHSLPWTLNSANGLHCQNVESHWAWGKIQPQRSPLPSPFDAAPSSFSHLTLCSDLSAHSHRKLQPEGFGPSPIMMKSLWILIQSSDILSSCVYQLLMGLPAINMPIHIFLAYSVALDGANHRAPWNSPLRPPWSFLMIILWIGVDQWVQLSSTQL